MDEVGRGTTVDDGLAIAFASIHHLLKANGCRVLFATHFHELADMLGHSDSDDKGTGIFKSIRFYCTNVDETEVRSYSPYSNETLVHFYPSGWLFCLFSPIKTWSQS